MKEPILFDNQWKYTEPNYNIKIISDIINSIGNKLVDKSIYSDLLKKYTYLHQISLLGPYNYTWDIYKNLYSGKQWIEINMKSSDTGEYCTHDILYYKNLSPNP